MGLIFEWLIAVIVFPVNMLVIIPAIVLYYTDYTWHANNVGWTIVGVALLLLGLVFTAWTTGLFARKGKGTAAPWCPPKNLIVEGPYAYVRNPMIISMFAMQNAECLLLNSWALFGLFILFLLGKLIYLPFFEEKDLEKRFGQSYLEYKRHVPRWIPRLTPWSPSPSQR